MERPPIPDNEDERLAALHALGLLDTEAEEHFDRITRLAQRVLGVPIALVSLVDGDRQWFKSRIGLDPQETSRDASFCAHAIVDDADVFVVEDATVDRRFSDNPLVVGQPEIRFYAGSPIAGPDGSKLGTLCVIDRVPRELSKEDEQALRDLAAIVERELEVRQTSMVDPLTGAYNRRGFELLAAHVFRSARRQHVPVSVVYLDLDGLKLVNDAQGHGAGDALIVRAAEVLSSTFRDSDVVARLGGDEFAVVLTGEGAVDRALVRLDAAIEREQSDLSFSVGAVTFEVEGDTLLSDVLARADEAMYAQKRSKR